MKKTTLLGFELELFTIDSSGAISSKVDSILSQVTRKEFPHLKKECAKNMLEVIGSPFPSVHGAMNDLMTHVEFASYVAEKEKLLLCPLSCYPGVFAPSMRKEKLYRIKERIFGPRKFQIAGRCIGFHCHTDLPHGIFDDEVRALQLLVGAKVRDAMVNSYNLMIAADPIFSTFAQSSPYYQGRYLGKDSRIIMYRGGSDLGNPYGLYAKFEELGGLPPYKLTVLGLHDLITSRYDAWKSALIKAGINLKTLSLYGSVLETSWNPIKVNPHGTLEQRGMDMNYLSTIAALGVLMHSTIRKIQQQRLIAIPSEIGIENPFKQEKDVIHIPPNEYVRKVLQRFAAYEGLENTEIYGYCKAFLDFAMKDFPRGQLGLIKPLQKMLSSKKTLSDEILAYAHRNGFSRRQPLTQDFAQELAIHYSEEFQSDFQRTKDMLRKNS